MICFGRNSILRQIHQGTRIETGTRTEETHGMMEIYEVVLDLLDTVSRHRTIAVGLLQGTGTEGTEERGPDRGLESVAVTPALDPHPGKQTKKQFKKMKKLQCIVYACPFKTLRKPGLSIPASPFPAPHLPNTL